jgi:hypothetical protein
LTSKVLQTLTAFELLLTAAVPDAAPDTVPDAEVELF